MLTKTRLIETIEQFPDEFTLDELIDKAILIDKIERSTLQSDESNIISEKSLDEAKWFK